EASRLPARAPRFLSPLMLLVRRHRPAVATAAAAAALLLLGTILYVVSLREARDDAESFRHKEASERARAEWRSYVADIAAAESALRVNDVATARRRLEQARVALRDWEWLHFASRLDRSRRTFRVHTEGAQAVAYSPDGKRIVSGGGFGSLRVWDFQTGAEVAMNPAHRSTVAS